MSTQFDTYLKPIDLEAIAQKERGAQKEKRHYLVQTAPARFDEAYSFVVTNRATGDAYDIDLFPAPTGYRARCTCTGFVLGSATCIHIRKALIFHVSIQQQERVLYAEAEPELSYEDFLAYVGIASDDAARRLYNDYLSGDLALAADEGADDEHSDA